MDFFSNLSNHFTKAAEYTVRKTGEFSDLAKLKLQQNQLASRINEQYLQIGKLIYKQYKSQTDKSGEIAALCVEIEQANEDLLKIGAELENRRAPAAKEDPAQSPDAEETTPDAEEPCVCDCDAQTSATETEDPQESDPSDTILCPACGQAIAAKAVFCPECGQKIK